ncbi:carboxylesterase family protein [Flavobacterium sp. DG1-102-2]|uniref:carboxylesterase/lipase family protein n=1 Tax=Flavobacterium sp. DG1-102-2 TaxID=3081663 RepID=UPI0029499F3E|nr:carboxylesterase family protein [Flavobacterium sp. DG1-102-2]MDV6167249.1 carboxylesterase family protein [Flavobacterium sp. DG1-102-2]
MNKKCLVLLLIIQSAFCVLAQKAPQAKVEQGTVEGMVLKSGIQNYRGIPFAEPPVGELRWKAPQPAKKWSGVRKAVEFGSNAMQKPVFGDMSFRAPSMNEDCLYLNVWTPAKKSTDKLPVLVYFYGGGFIAGDGSENRYDGESLAEKGIVTVTLNYRLGIFGFFSHPELTKESPNHASGNYGLLDQNAALLWVQKNIAAFGGDPNKITIAGESAGSISVSAQMVSPLSSRLIAGAIGQSGAMINPTLAAVPLADAERNGVAFAEKINVTELSKLRSIPAEQLLEEASKPGAFITRATLDGYFLTMDPIQAYQGGYHSQIPLLVGWTSAEIPYQAFMQGQYPNPENYKKRVQETYKDWAAEILKKYSGKNEREVIESATALGSDGFIVYSTWKWAELHKSYTKKPVYTYVFSRQRPSLKSELGNMKEGLAGGLSKDENKKEETKMPEGVKGANHASDIEYALGNLASNTSYEWSADDYKTSAAMEDYFANFIKTGNPNGKNLPEWLPCEYSNALNIMEINVTSKAGPEQNRERYLLLDNYFTTKK